MTKALVRIVLVSLTLHAGAVLQAAPDQPHMRAAIELLQAAKKSDRPMPMLIAAKKHIQNAKSNKKGERAEALESINAAISRATVGDLAKMIPKINDAIAQIHSGMDKAK